MFYLQNLEQILEQLNYDKFISIFRQLDHNVLGSNVFTAEDNHFKTINSEKKLYMSKNGTHTRQISEKLYLR